MTPECVQPAPSPTPWGSPLLYTVLPAPPSPRYSLVYSQPLYQPQILQAVTAVQSLPLAAGLAGHQPPVSQFFRQTKGNVKPIADKTRNSQDALQESYCKKKKKAESRRRKTKPKVIVGKMREEFILSPDKKLPARSEPGGSDSEGESEGCQMPTLEVQVSPRAAVPNRTKCDGVKRAKPAARSVAKATQSEDESAEGDIIQSLRQQVDDGDDSDLDLFVSVKETDSSESGEAAFEKLLSSAAAPKGKRRKSPAWAESPPKRDKVSPSLEVTTTPWGGATAASFDLSDDYVNDYLKDKSKTDSTKSPNSSSKPPGLLMISPPTPTSTQRRSSSRAVSMDVIPACLPDSVGSEIGDILRGGFLTVSPPAPRTPRRRGGRASGRSSPQKVAKEKVKNSRTKSTEDLPPNLLPEDYLDEVIGQYFNADSSSEEEQRVEEAKEVVTKPSSNTDSEEDSSTEDGGHTRPRKARSRPPASFFSMDFLEEPAHSDTTEQPDKVKTDLEIEKEYRHILYGKKRRPAKISIGKKKKTSSPQKNGSEKLKRKVNSEKPEKVVGKHKLALKQKSTVLREANGKAKQQSPKVQPVKKPVQTTRAKSPAKEPEPPAPEEIPMDIQHTWRGKTPNQRAYDRSAMLQNTVRSRPNVSAKIEDVTGRYSKEEELAKCGICEMMDPPIDPDAGTVTAETEWIGCDCFRWFHKGCTKLAKFTDKFSCKSVKMKCLEVEEDPKELETDPEVLRIAILKFCRDRDTMFIDDVMT